MAKRHKKTSEGDGPSETWQPSSTPSPQSSAAFSPSFHPHGDDGLPVDGASVTFSLPPGEYAHLGRQLYGLRVAYRIWITTGEAQVTGFEIYPPPPPPAPSLFMKAGTYVDVVKDPDSPAITILGRSGQSTTVRAALVGFPPR